jgi:phage repressor protein C with HTH and peptisase S24 domain
MNVKFSERLNFLVTEHSGGKVTHFAKKAGIPPGTFDNYLKGRLPQAEQLLRIRETYGVNIDWLLTGEGEPYIGGRTKKEGLPEDCLSPEDFVIIPMLESRIAAGPEGEVLYEEVKDYYPFKRWWIEKFAGKTEARLKNLVLLKVRGDSMSPTIDQGEVILVDTHERERMEIRTGQIYLVTMPDGSSAIKRLALSETAGRQKLICMSDNVAVYRPFDFELDPAKSIKHYVLGRVRWAGKEFE